MTHDPMAIVKHGHLAPHTIMIGALAKALIKNNILTREQLIAELEHYRGLEGTAELDVTIQAIRKW